MPNGKEVEAIIAQYRSSRYQMSERSYTLIKKLMRFVQIEAPVFEGGIVDRVDWPDDKGFTYAKFDTGDEKFRVYSRVGEKRAEVVIPTSASFYRIEEDEITQIEYQSLENITKEEIQPLIDLFLEKISNFYQERTRALDDIHARLSRSEDQES